MVPRVFWWGACLAAILFVAAYVIGVPAHAEASPVHTTLRDFDRHQTAVEISRVSFSPKVGAVVLAWLASHGRIRLPLWDMDELFPLVAVGTKVHSY